MNEGHVQGDCPVCGFFPLRSVSSVVWKKKYENRLYATLLTERRHLYKMAFGGMSIGIASIGVRHPQTRSSTPSGQHSLANLIHASCVLHFPHYAGLSPHEPADGSCPNPAAIFLGRTVAVCPGHPRRSAQQSPYVPCLGRHSRALASPAQVGTAEPLLPLPRSAYFDHPLIWQGIYKIIVPQYPAASQVHPFLHSLYG